MIREHRPRTPVAILSALLLASGLWSMSCFANGSWYDSHCSPCHDAAPTCDGCHEHSGSLSATSDQGEYQPGAPLVVTLHGGTRGGWIRGILYDAGGQEIVVVGGEEFPVDLPASAPDEPGDYHWNAAWFGSNNGVGHLERLTPITIRVIEDPASVEEEEPTIYRKSWGKIKGYFLR